jgi:RNA polymerase sigma-70 factor, ECF subfamily
MTVHPPERDRAAFAAVVAEHQAALYRYARVLCRDALQAEDVLQETLMAGLRGWAGFRGDASVRSWLFTLARHTAQRSARPRAGQPTTFEALGELASDAGWGNPSDNPEHRVASAERRAAMNAALSQLKPEDQEVIVLRDLEQLSGPEVAKILELAPDAVRARHHRARLRLMSVLRKEGLANEE